jgi:hypothetical protein
MATNAIPVPALEKDRARTEVFAASEIAALQEENGVPNRIKGFSDDTGLKFFLLKLDNGVRIGESCASVGNHHLSQRSPTSPLEQYKRRVWSQACPKRPPSFVS